MSTLVAEKVVLESRLKKAKAENKDELYDIFVRLPKGTCITLSVKARDSVVNLKRQVARVENVKPEQQRFTHNSQELEGRKSLGVQGVVRDSTLYLSTRGQGGGKTTVKKDTHTKDFMMSKARSTLALKDLTSLPETKQCCEVCEQFLTAGTANPKAAIRKLIGLAGSKELKNIIDNNTNNKSFRLKNYSEALFKNYIQPVVN